MNILVFGANWYNRGDEAAIRALLDELTSDRDDLRFVFSMNQYMIGETSFNEWEIIDSYAVESRKKHPFNWMAQCLLYATKGKVNLMTGKYRINYKKNVEAIKWADYAIYAPGGPCIGDIYRCKFLYNLMNIMMGNGLKYFFYAPSMGPFKFDREWILEVINGCDVLCVREELSKEHLSRLGVSKDVIVTLDSAVQREINHDYFEEILLEDAGLKSFIQTGKVIGITLTDLQWNSMYRDSNIKDKIEKTFRSLILSLRNDGYKIIFIPQQFGKDNDYNYLKSYAVEGCYVLPDTYDCYFQQHLISKLYAVIGMRYHSNVFSAKMCTPCVAISYEQKTAGFMRECKLSNYCIDVNDINEEVIYQKFQELNNNYAEYKAQLENLHDSLRHRSHKTTELLEERLNAVYGA